MQQKKWFVSYAVKPKGQETKTLHTFIQGADVEDALEKHIFEIKELMELDTDEITVISVSLV